MVEAARFKPIVVAVVGALVGGLLGATIGWAAPGYYRAVFLNGSDPSFNPFAVGLGLGATQGAGAGAALAGAILVLNIARRRPKAERGPGSVWSLWTAVTILSLCLVLRELPNLWGRTPPRAAWREGKIALWNFALSDQIATHLISGEKQAALDPPILLRSHFEESSVDLAALDWRDGDGKSCPSPAKGHPLTVVAVETTDRIR